MASADPARLAELARADGRLGLDTEFMPEGRYKPLLCLVQIAAGDEIAVLDPLRGVRPRAARGACSPIPRSRSSSTPAARTSRSCAASGRRTFTNVFDTQIAAGFAGFSAQAGYNGLLHDVLKVRLPEDRELHALGRAAADRGAAALRARRRRAPARAGRRDRRPARRRAGGSGGRARSAGRSPRPPTSAIPSEVWRRLPRVNGLDARDRAVARELAAWRERTAAEEDRPVGSVLRDPTVVELAKRQPAGRRELAQIRGVNPDVVRRRGAALLEAIARGREAEPRPSRRRRPAADRVRRRAGDRARRGARAQPSAGGRARVRADRRARGPRADRRRARRGARGARRAHAARLAPRAGRRRAAGAAGGRRTLAVEDGRVQVSEA